MISLRWTAWSTLLVVILTSSFSHGGEAGLDDFEHRSAGELESSDEGELAAMNNDEMPENELDQGAVKLDERADADAPVVRPNTYFCGKPYYCCSGLCCMLTTSCIDGQCYRITDNRAVPAEPVCQSCDIMQLSITADDRLEAVYFDGVEYPMSTLANITGIWSAPKTIPIPATTKVIAVRSTDNGRSTSVAGLLASINHNYLVTGSSAWKCSNTYRSNWMHPDYIDVSWPSAYAYARNPDTANHGSQSLAPISTSASWIWTNRYRSSGRFVVYDQTVYCRGRPPKHTCDSSYGQCGNLCARQNKICCHCDMLDNGPVKVCSCCPRGYHCCGPTRHRSYVCCPIGSKCNKDSGTCVTWNLARTYGTCPSNAPPTGRK